MVEQIKKAIDLLPNTAESKVILEQRTAQLAIPIAFEQESEEEYQYLQFQLNNGALYGIPLAMLDEVIDSERLTLLNWLPPFIMGVKNWQGKVLSVLDTNYLCSEQKITEINTESKVIIVINSDKFMGLMVNKVDSFISYKPSNLKTNIQSPTKLNPAYFLGLHNDSVILLNIDMILSDLALEIK